MENRPQLMPSIHLAWNPKCVIVQWVGIGNKHTVFIDLIIIFTFEHVFYVNVLYWFFALKVNFSQIPDNIECDQL